MLNGRKMGRIKVAFFDGDGVVIDMPEEHFHERYARENGVDLNLFPEFFGPGYKKILRGNGNLEDHIRAYENIWGKHDPKELVAEWINYNSQINEPLVEVIQRKRQEGVSAYLATAQESERLRHMKEILLPNAFDGIYATCELGFLKVEDEDKHPETYIMLEDPPAKYYSRLLGGLAVSPDQIAYFDDREDNIEIACKKGIEAHIYESPEQVEAILSR
jgi:putative hydrolase of the HAD superfamily